MLTVVRFVNPLIKLALIIFVIIMKAYLICFLSLLRGTQPIGLDAAHKTLLEARQFTQVDF